ncbi:MAG: replication initiator, partial [Cutibacterium avidum]|nr:replication initiator [Cutibacterium avidum]
MTAHAGAHFDGFGEAAPLDVDLSPRGQANLLARIKDGTFDQFAQAAAHVGYCTHPIRLTGSTTRIDTTTGEILSVFRSTDQPLGVLFQRCGNRRESVCPSCSRLYARDTFEMVRCGVTGGKNVPDSVADNPLVFLTLTAPSFGPVHGTRSGRPCHPRREGQLCPHGRPMWCNTRHTEDDSLLGQPICSDCYRYDHHLIWQWWAPELWRRFTITLRRHLAALVGVAPSKLNDVCSVQFAKVAEMQTRGAIHFHALIRLDGPAAQGIG